MITDKKRIIRKINRKIISKSILLFPQKIIKSFSIKPNTNAKAMGLILKGYCNLYKITRKDEYLNKAKTIAYWLIEHRSENTNGYGWGYPFNWSSNNLYIPKNTPSSVVSAIVGDGFYDLYEITSDKNYLKVCKEICRFFIENLNIDVLDDERVCFSYTPLDHNHVHNSNLFVSEYLIKLGKLIDNRDYIDIGKKAVEYTISEQNKDGSIFYWGSKDSKYLKLTFSKIDHYHTGFELRKLWEISQHLNDKRINVAFNKYFKYYRNNLVGNNRINMRPLKPYPLNIHSFSEFIICNSIVNDGNNIEEKWFDDIFNRHYYELLDNDGLFIYQIQKLIFIKYKSRFKYLRWGQAWMFLALTQYLTIKK